MIFTRLQVLILSCLTNVAFNLTLVKIASLLTVYNYFEHPQGILNVFNIDNSCSACKKFLPCSYAWGPR